MKSQSFRRKIRFTLNAFLSHPLIEVELRCLSFKEHTDCPKEMTVNAQRWRDYLEICRPTPQLPIFIGMCLKKGEERSWKTFKLCREKEGSSSHSTAQVKNIKNYYLFRCDIFIARSSFSSYSLHHSLHHTSSDYSPSDTTFHFIFEEYWNSLAKDANEMWTVWFFHCVNYEFAHLASNSTRTQRSPHGRKFHAYVQGKCGLWFILILAFLILH